MAKFIVESIATNASRYGAAHALVVCEDIPQGPAHTMTRLVISGDLDSLVPSGIANDLKEGMKLSIEIEAE